jgi:Amt family ammonium transporter
MLLAGELPMDDTQVILDNLWVFIAGVLVLFMQAGFAMLEAGLTQAKGVSTILLKNFLDMCIGVVAFALVGYHIAFSGSLFFGWDWQWAGMGAPPTTENTLTVPVQFFFQVAFAATAATIVSGALAGRAQMRGYVVYSALITALIYPVVVGWTWGGGWLSELGTPFQDFAGSTVVHSTGGWAALVGALILGPRLGKYDENGEPRPIPGHSMPLFMLGVFILLIGWFGFNPGSQLAADLEVPRIAMNTVIAGSAGALVATAISWSRFGNPDISMAGNGLLAGLVSITAGCWALDGWGAGITGSIAGAIVVIAVLTVERGGIDDPVGAISVHGICGVWGTLAVGLFAVEGAPVLGEGTTGLAYGGGFDQLISQVIGIVAVFTFVTITAGTLFLFLKRIGWLRVSAAHEHAGLDVSELGAPAYSAA